MKTFESYGLTAGSLFKVLFLGLLVPLFLFGLACGIASCFGYDTITFNNQHVHGIKGILVGCIIGIILPAIFAAFLWCLTAFGIFVWTRFKKITLTIKD